MSRLLIATLLFTLTVGSLRADVTLIANGKANCVVRVEPAVMALDKMPAPTKFAEAEPERQRQRLRESVKDLALYLGKISGAKVEVETADKPGDDPRIPIYIGAKAAAAFGPVGKTAPYKQGFRYVVGAKGVGLYGESDLASSYAIYELLDRLGCRWFIPSDMGEVIPEAKTIALKEVDFPSAPFTTYRGVWYADDSYRRRNRMGGLLLSAGHALEFYVSKEDQQKHPEWVAEIGGKPRPGRLRWSSPTLADFLADKLIGMHAKDPQPSYSLSPDDGSDWDESKDDKAIDAGDFDPGFQKVSITDRLMVLCNRVATKSTAKHPDMLFGMLAYVDYTRPPVREKVHPSVIPQIAPITYSRAHPMTDDRVPGNKDLRYLIEGWGKKASATSMYYYGWFLAEPAAPNPMMRKWAVDVPFAFKNNCKFWQPETLANYESSMHGLYMANRLAWDPKITPEEVYAELNAKFYGNASKEMAAYWKQIDDTWVDTPEYSGCGFGYLRRWTTEAMAKARSRMDAGLAAAKTPMEKQRVELANESLKLFELFMKLRRDQAEGHFATIATDAATWKKTMIAMSEKYKDQYTFTRAGWAKDTVNGSYFGSFYQLTYDDADRVAKAFNILTTTPVRNFRWQIDPDKKGEAAGWAKPDFDDKAWKSTDVCVETWSTLGHHDYFKSMWYRTEVDVPAAPAGKKTFLWLGSTDGSAKVFVNGKHIPYVDAKGKVADDANGFCQPFSFDISSALKPGKNSVAILTTRTFFNELGTGGLIGPAMIYREKP